MTRGLWEFLEVWKFMLHFCDPFYSSCLIQALICSGFLDTKYLLSYNILIKLQ